MALGGGQIFDPSAMGTGADLMNPIASQAIPQQASQWAQDRMNLSDFLTGVAGDRDQMMAIINQLRAMQKQVSTQGTAGLLGALGVGGR